MEEDKIEAFFREMKKADEHVAIPPFPKRKEPRKLPAFLYAAAAVVAVLAVTAYVVRQAGGERVQPGEVIILVHDDALKTQSLGDVREESLSEWKSPTGYLSEDF